MADLKFRPATKGLAGVLHRDGNDSSNVGGMAVVAARAMGDECIESEKQLGRTTGALHLAVKNGLPWLPGWPWRLSCRPFLGAFVKNGLGM